MISAKEKAYSLLRRSERLFKTDMVYLTSVGFWTSLNTILNSVFSLVLSVAFANLLSKEVYGTYQFLLSLSALITAICLGGMQHAVAQSVARGNEGDVQLSLKTQLKWNFIPTSLGLAASIYYGMHHNYVVAIGLLIISILSPLTNAFGIYAAFLSGKRLFKRLFFYSTFLSLIYYASILLTVTFFKSSIVLISVNLAVNAVVTIILYFHTLKVCKPNTNTDGHTISYGKHLSVMNAFGTVISQIDSILVFHFLGAVNLAIYSFATLIPERVAGISSFIGTAAFPKFAQRKLEEIKKSIVSQTVRVAIFGLVITVIYIIAAPTLFHLFFPKYLNALPYTRWYAPVILLMSANLASQALVAQRLKKELYISTIVNPILLITLQLPLLILYGIWGMIIARLVTDLVGIIISTSLILRKKLSKESD
jgi:O-antigen/teichoic acid export membrane protein